MIRQGVTLGAAAGMLFFVVDLAATFAAVGQLFDATLDTAALLAVAGAVAVTLGALAGAALFAVAGQSIASRWRSAGVTSRRGAWMSLCGALIAVFLAGTLSRSRRNLTAPVDERPAALQRPPVLWIVIDTLRRDTLYGPKLDFPLAPELGAFARDSMIFTDAESSAGWTIPATATLLTGIHSTTTDASGGFLPDWAPTLAEHLWTAGYRTDAVIDNALLEPRSGFGAGFETLFQRSGFRFAFSLPSFRILPTWARERLRGLFRTFYYGSPGVTEAAVQVLEQASERPHFMYVHYMDTHAPYHPHPELGPDPPGTEPIDYYTFRDILEADGDSTPSDKQLARLEHRYEGELRWIDRDIGRLIKAWHSRYGRTGMVMLTSDHGEEFLDHGRLGHGMTVHREMVGVPLLVQLPAAVVAPGSAHGVDNTPTSHMDLVPTVLDWLGLDPGAAGSIDGSAMRPQGVSMLERWRTGKAQSRPMFSSHSRHGRRVYRYREGPWVYLKTMFYDDRPTQRSLYNLDVDPREQHDVSAAEPDMRAGMSGRFERLATALREANEGGEPGDAQASEESLRALGYIQ